MKLGNILLESELKKTLKIVDFGICGMFRVGQDGDKSDAGSLRYITPALDIWSMGCIFYAMLSGCLPFRGKTRKDIIDNIIEVIYDPLPAQLAPS